MATTRSRFDDNTFIKTYEEHGMAGTRKIFNLTQQAIAQRRTNLERKYNIVIKSPTKAPVSRVIRYAIRENSRASWTCYLHGNKRCGDHWIRLSLLAGAEINHASCIG